MATRDRHIVTRGISIFLTVTVAVWQSFFNAYQLPKITQQATVRCRAVFLSRAPGDSYWVLKSSHAHAMLACLTTDTFRHCDCTSL
jgi:hypothetical protein